MNLDLAQYADRFDFDGTVSGIKELKKSPTYIFLGSSLFRYPMWELDESCGKLPAGHEQSHVWLTAKNALSDNYSFAIAGALVSDFNLIFQKYVQHDIKNDVVLIECAPRSFYDSGIHPTATPVFKYFCGFADVLKPHSIFFASDTERFQWMINALLPMSRYRHDVQEGIAGGATSLLAKAPIPSVKNTHTKTPDDFVASANPTKVFAHSLAEYKGRYAGINKADVDIQLNQLKELVEAVQERKARPVLVVMPLTKQNLDLLPPSFYSDWRQSVIRLASQQDCRVLDLSAGVFGGSDFYDCAHLNVQGGTKFLRILEEQNLQSERTAGGITPPAGTLSLRPIRTAAY